jgi:pyruvate dehydrogenase complex dehydrogenase (E1) component
MALFDKQTKPIPRFAYRSEAFDYYFAKLIEEGRDEMSAAEQADKFATIVATNKRLPDTPPPPMNAIEKGVYYANQIASIKRDHPDIWDLLTSVAGGLIGGFTGGATAVAIQEPTTENIDFNNLQ